MMAARLFRLLNRTDRRLIEQRASHAIAGWQSEWLANPVTVTLKWVDARELSELSSERWMIGTIAADVAVGIGIATSGEASLLSALLGFAADDASRGARSATIPDVATAALQALVTTLLAAAPHRDGDHMAQWTDSVEADRIADVAQGYATLRYRLPEVELSIVLFPLLAERYIDAKRNVSPASRSPLVRLRKLVHSQSVILEVSAGEVELSLADIATLAAGDVISLNRRLEEPLPLLINGEIVCRGHLGASGSRKALQLTSTPVNPEV